MKRSIVIVLTCSMFLFLFCSRGAFCQDQNKAKQEIEKVMALQGKVWQTGDIEFYKSRVAPEVKGFGGRKEAIYSNKKEMISGLEEIFQSLGKGDLHYQNGYRNLSIQVSENENMATSMYEVPYEIHYEKSKNSGLWRVNITWKKKNNKWMIVQWFAYDIPE